jgi:hypothetical protein
LGRALRRRLLWFSVGAEFFPLRLCHDERRVLGMRCKARKLHRGQGGRGKQHEAKSGHVMSVPRKTTDAKKRGDQQTINKYRLGRNVAASPGGRG